MEEILYKSGKNLTTTSDVMSELEVYSIGKGHNSNTILRYAGRDIENVNLPEIHKKYNCTTLFLYSKNYPEALEYLKNQRSIDGVTIMFEHPNIKILEEFTHLKRLSLTLTSYEQLDLKKLNKLESLSTNSRYHKSAKDLPVSLKTLQIESYDSKSLEDLSHLKNLEKLSILKGSLTTTKGLSNFKNLKELELMYLRNLDDLTDIDKGMGLEYVDLRALPKIHQVDSLSKLKLLKSVNLDNFKEDLDISSFSNLTNLHTFGADKSNIKSLRPLTKLSNLKEVYIFDGNILDGDTRCLLNSNLKTYLFDPRKHYNYTLPKVELGEINEEFAPGWGPEGKL